MQLESKFLPFWPREQICPFFGHVSTFPCFFTLKANFCFSCLERKFMLYLRWKQFFAFSALKANLRFRNPLVSKILALLSFGEAFTQNRARGSHETSWQTLPIWMWVFRLGVWYSTQKFHRKACKVLICIVLSQLILLSGMALSTTWINLMNCCRFGDDDNFYTRSIWRLRKAPHAVESTKYARSTATGRILQKHIW